MATILTAHLVHLRLLAETNEFRHAEMPKIAEIRFRQVTKLPKMPKMPKMPKNAENAEMPKMSKCRKCRYFGIISA
jgi:hypothetical protein